MVEATICVFAKPPVAGKAKTRLAPAIGADRAAALAEAFLRDTLESLRQLSWASVIIAATEPFERVYLPTDGVWIQPEGTLDQRIEAILKKALQLTPLAFAIGADSPGLPVRHIEEARRLMVSHDAVVGPSMDGGFYALGVKRYPDGLLQGVEWSQRATLEQTMIRLRQYGLSLALLPEWFDVDTVHELLHLENLLANGLVDCPHTQAAIDDLRRSKVMAISGK